MKQKKKIRKDKQKIFHKFNFLFLIELIWEN
jgi:hypothetical protein